jgi:hypothetical protein
MESSSALVVSARGSGCAFSAALGAAFATAEVTPPHRHKQRHRRRARRLLSVELDRPFIALVITKASAPIFVFTGASSFSVTAKKACFRVNFGVCTGTACDRPPAIPPLGWGHGRADERRIALDLREQVFACSAIPVTVALAGRSRGSRGHDLHGAHRLRRGVGAAAAIARVDGHRAWRLTWSGVAEPAA